MAKSRFEEMSGDVPTETTDDEAMEYVPSVIFTQDAGPDLSKMRIPRLRLAQGMTPEVAEWKAQIGDFVLTNFPAMPEVILVPLAGQNIRQYKPDPKAPPQCQAPTGDYGVGTPGGSCELCPLSKWGPRDPVTKKSTKPPCADGVVIRAYSVNHRCVVDFQFMGRTSGTGAFIQQQAMVFGYTDFAIKLTGSQTSNSRGQWFEPVVEMLSEVPEDHKEIVLKWYDALVASQVATREEAKNLLTPGGTP